MVLIWFFSLLIFFQFLFSVFKKKKKTCAVSHIHMVSQECFIFTDTYAVCSMYTVHTTRTSHSSKYLTSRSVENHKTSYSCQRLRVSLINPRLVSCIFSSTSVPLRRRRYNMRGLFELLDATMILDARTHSLIGTILF